MLPRCYDISYLVDMITITGHFGPGRHAVLVCVYEYDCVPVCVHVCDLCFDRANPTSWVLYMLPLYLSSFVCGFIVLVCVCKEHLMRQWKRKRRSSRRRQVQWTPDTITGSSDRKSRLSWQPGTIDQACQSPCSLQSPIRNGAGGWRRRTGEQEHRLTGERMRTDRVALLL